MNGLAKLLRALYPNLDWSTPETTIRSVLPATVDLDQLINFVNAVPRLVSALAAKQAEIDAALARIESLLAQGNQKQSENEDYSGEHVPIVHEVTHGRSSPNNGNSGRRQLASTAGNNR